MCDSEKLINGCIEQCKVKLRKMQAVLGAHQKHAHTVTHPPTAGEETHTTSHPFKTPTPDVSFTHPFLSFPKMNCLKLHRS
jgi:hypothetical protein